MSAKKIAVKKSGAANSDINVTPLVDVVLVLLIIFMVVTPLLEKDIAVRVPNTEVIDDPQTKTVPKDQLVVRIDEQGNLRIEAGKRGEAVTTEKFASRLSEILSPRNLEDRVVFVVAEEKTNYGRVVAIIDSMKQAGAETIGMATQLPEEANKVQ